MRAETEAIRNALLASISHDLRTPLATIAGGAATLAGNLEALSDADRRALANSVSEEATRMSERITTLLDLVRLETGAIQPRFDHVRARRTGRLGAASARCAAAHAIACASSCPRALPLLQRRWPADRAGAGEPARQRQQVHAGRQRDPHQRARAARARSRSASRTTVRACRAADPEILFEKFQRGAPEGAVGGIGLGLAICRTIVRLHSGRIWAENRAPHGAAFRFSVPQSDEPAANPNLDEVPAR